MKKNQNFGSKTQPIGGQVSPITSLKVPPKNPALESGSKGQGLMNHLQYYQEEIGNMYTFGVGGHTCDEAGSRMTEETP